MSASKDGKQQVLVFWSWLNRATFLRAAKGPRWIQRRFRLWKQTAMASIQRQSITDWRYVLICHPASARYTEPLREQIDDPRIALVHDGEEEKAWRAALPKADRYVVARLDSDDRYHPSVGARYLAHAHRTRGRRSYLQFGRGFAYVMATGELFDWKQSSSPFHAQILGPEYRGLEVPPCISHAKVAGRALALPGACFVVTIHGANTTTNLRSSCVGEPIGGARARRVARAFGLPKIVLTPKKGKPKKPWRHLTAADVPDKTGSRIYFPGTRSHVRR